MKKVAVGILGLIFCYGLLCLAQTPPVASPTPGAVAAVVSAPPVQSGLAGLVSSKGGLMAFGLLLITCFNLIVSGLRSACAMFDGVNPGDAAPAGDKVLSTLNVICLWVGKALDWVGSNVQH